MPDAPSPRILVADDEVPQMRALCDTFARARLRGGWREQRPGGSGIAQARAVDLLLTDLRMPEMDGITLLRTATAIDPYLVGVVMTGEGSISTAVEAM